MIARFSLWLLVLGLPLQADIPKPDDAPLPRSPEETVASYVVPHGFMVELVASEPLIQSPSGVCWDAEGRLYVSELHGYNLEGQLDIEALNDRGKLDTEVRRVQADDVFKDAAKSGTYGVIKRLEDSDGDGRMDRSTIFAGDLPPAYGMVAARGGLIVACAPDIVFLADRNGDGVAEEREVLYTGFGLGPLERGINAPQWTADGWITFGRGADGGKITGPHLKEPVELPRTDFRIRPDGTAIEPVTGGTHTFGFTHSQEGHRFVVSTTAPAIQVAPIDYRYLIRNPNAASAGLMHDITPDRRAYPLSQAHPWRQKRAEHTEYFEYYRSRYGASDSDPSGWFTSACSPFVYQDDIIPGLTGHFLACDPAQNFVFRGLLTRSDDPSEIVYKLARKPDEAAREFCASSDAWSHPIALSHGPDGAVWIVDYYREIIEDYSAIPRHLQQQYGLYHGHDRGRIYRLTHKDAKMLAPVNLAGLDSRGLLEVLGTSPSLWRRETALRLLREGNPLERGLIESDSLPAMALLEAWGLLRESDLLKLLQHEGASHRVQGLRFAERLLRMGNRAVLDEVSRMLHSEHDPWVLLQLALSLGESMSDSAFDGLVHLARTHGHVRWMTTALLSSLYLREERMRQALNAELGQGADLLKHLQEKAELVVAKAVPSDVVPPLDEGTYQKYVAGLTEMRDVNHGGEVFQQHCAMCHRIGDVGVDVGPDILGETGAGESSLLRQILAPHERIRPGYETTVITLTGERGEIAGILKEDGATSLTLGLPGGVDQVVLRKDVASMDHVPRSLMPSAYRELLSPKDAADLLAWVQSPQLVVSSTNKLSSMPAIGDKLSDAQVRQFAELALKGIFQEFPNKPSNVIQNVEGIRSPQQMHPVFYGCFDWHSSVHGHWMLVHLLRAYPESDIAGEIEAAMEKQFQRDRMEKEVAYFEEKGNASFERMYGWAWALRLAMELRTWDDPRGRRWAEALRPLEEKIVELTMGYLPRLTWPIRTGVHPDTAFAIGQCLDYARAVGHRPLEALLVERATFYYSKDVDYRPAYEPSGEDFFSASLNEADLMRRVLDQAAFAAWLDKFLPAFDNLFMPVEVSDVTDGKLVHLAGLNLSRGWTLDGIASALPAGSPRRQSIEKAAQGHTLAGLKYVFSGHYEGEHWLATFAIYTLSRVGLR